MKFTQYAYRISKWILRLGTVWVLLILLYTCLYIYFCAPDHGTMRDFRHAVADLLCHAIATLCLLFVAAAIPDVKVL
jgi:hypothetical protein